MQLIPGVLRAYRGDHHWSPELRLEASTLACPRSGVVLDRWLPGNGCPLDQWMDDHGSPLSKRPRINRRLDGCDVRRVCGALRLCVRFRGAVSGTRSTGNGLAFLNCVGCGSSVAVETIAASVHPFALSHGRTSDRAGVYQYKARGCRSRGIAMIRRPQNNALERTRRVGVPALRAVLRVSPRRSTQCCAGLRWEHHDVAA